MHTNRAEEPENLDEEIFLAEMQSFSSISPGQIEVIKEIGKGAYGTVYKARDTKHEGRFLAMKEIRIPVNMEEGMPMSTIREIGLLKQLEKYDHPNVVKYADLSPHQR